MSVETARLMVDTNVLLFALCPHLPERDAARSALLSAEARGWKLCLTTQIVRECLVVMTGSMQSRLKWPVQECLSALDEHTRGFEIRKSDEASLEKLKELVLNFELRGKRIHDANIVANMLAGRVPALLTHNLQHFSDFAGLIKLIPLASAAEVLA